MIVTKRRTTSDNHHLYELLWSSLADKALGIRRRKTVIYPQTAWEAVLPHLATWHSVAELKRLTGRNVTSAMESHANLMEKRGKWDRTQYRLKRK
jgi:hypothetical protein